MSPSNQTREQWLEASAALMAREVFTPAGYTVPQVRVSIGFTGSRGGAKVLGACWDAKATDDGVAQIFITPTQADSVDVQAVLVHELVHAVVGNKEKHGKVFKRCAEKVGLEGKMTATRAGLALSSRLNDFKRRLGSLPHAKLNPRMNPKKKQGTRLLKVMCSTDGGYVARVTKSWLDCYGAPICPCCKITMVF